jgi:hypothetical protein
MMTKRVSGRPGTPRLLLQHVGTNSLLIVPKYYRRTQEGMANLSKIHKYESFALGCKITNYCHETMRIKQ